MAAQPVEFAVAVERYLASAPLTDASRRVYRIALTRWAWTLVGEAPPCGADRRGARPPVVLLSALDDPVQAARVEAALAARSPRTRQRELSTLRSAVTWWRAQGWLAAGPLPEPHGTADAPAAPAAPKAEPRPVLTDSQLNTVLGLRATLRDQTLWHLLHDSGGSAEHVLALDIGDLDRPRRRTHVRAAPAAHRRDLPQLHWGEATGRLLSLLLVSRTAGPVFLTERRAPATTPPEDRCPLTGRGRLSYRRAAELFAGATRPLDPSGRGWTLHQL
ncbi:hypothetical protein [Streptacidiphilus fuscans]|uniref:Core-binding (CB) domain-containing protein n=1 Tax=Streptacidiphilus fuscans TaxID=2789292 RepID=A0A931B465_9ACTN|nr:hypothetical protein [Streptacidiphilus fuscans]MBF9069988.1 hypothetical protein [Streptacidiphilus fuscans]